MSMSSEMLASEKAYRDQDRFREGADVRRDSDAFGFDSKR